MADVRGIDISEHQGAWNWSAPQDTFVISRAWSGFRRDHQINRNWPASKGRTIRGSYAFAEPGGGSPEAQADAYLGIINAAGGHEAGDLIPMLDIEDARKWAGRDPIGFSLRFLARLSSNIGRNAGIYTDRGFLAGSLRNDRRFEPYPLWIANWNGNGSVGSYHDPRAPWGWYIHQYRGHPLDLNRADAGVLSSIRFGGVPTPGLPEPLPPSRRKGGAEMIQVGSQSGKRWAIRPDQRPEEVAQNVWNVQGIAGVPSVENQHDLMVIAIMKAWGAWGK